MPEVIEPAVEPVRREIVIRLTWRDETYEPVAEMLQRELSRIPGVSKVEVEIADPEPAA